MNRSAWTVYLKELLDALRDRRTLFVVLLSSVAMGPLVLVLVSSLVAGIEKRAEARVVVVQGIAHAPTLRNYLERQTYTVRDAPADYEQQLKDSKLGDPVVVAQFIERLQQHGIDPARVKMSGPAPSRTAYLARYAEVDMMLDSFPYPGVTTTCEALWMGVPTLTLAGETLLARQGAGVITAAGLGDWVASNVEEYIDKAIAWAGNLPKLTALRAGMREQVSASPLYDAERFARNFEAALWGMWQAKTFDNSAIPSVLLTTSPD